MKRQALGKGLDALLPKGVRQTALVELDLDKIRPNPLQPRVQIEASRLDELADSIAKNGVLQPIVVRKGGEHYEIIAGERRWRAAQKAGLERVPAVLKDVTDEKMLQLALVENIQRDELSAVEEAHAYRILQQDYKLTQEQIGDQVGRSRAAVANTLRLLQLPKSVQAMIVNGELSMGHARALIPLKPKNQLALAKATIRGGLSVRATEQRARALLADSAGRRNEQPADPNVRAAERRLEEHWKTKVQIRQQGNRGRVIFHFHSQEELERLFEGLLR